MFGREMWEGEREDTAKEGGGGKGGKGIKSSTDFQPVIIPFAVPKGGRRDSGWQVLQRSL